MGEPKISTIVKKIYLKYLYKFKTLVPFEALPLWLDAAIWVPLQLLETLSNFFNRNAVDGHQRFPLTSATSAKHLHFGQKQNSGCVPPLPDHAPCDLFGSHGWSRIWRAGILLTLQRFNENRWWPSTEFPLKILDSVSRIGNGAAIAASSRKGEYFEGD